MFIMPIVAILVALASGSAHAERVSGLLLEVALQSSEPGHYEFKLKITNTSPNPITIYDTDLPWITPNQQILVKRAYRMAGRRTSLTQYVPMEDYARTPNQLAPDESLTDTIDLNIMFPSLENDAKKYGVTIEWRCRSKRLEFRCKEGKGGKFMIGKNQTTNNGQDSSHTSPSPTTQQTK